jgi:hypothetical protein
MAAEKTKYDVTAKSDLENADKGPKLVTADSPAAAAIKGAAKAFFRFRPKTAVQVNTEAKWAFDFEVTDSRGTTKRVQVCKHTDEQPEADERQYAII